MNTLFIRSVALISFFWGGMFCMLPSASEAYNIAPWIDKIALEVTAQKALANGGNFDPYFKQLELLSEAAAKGRFCREETNHEPVLGNVGNQTGRH